MLRLALAAMGGEPVIRAEVDDLLGDVPLQSRQAPTAMPHTPLMRNAPSRPPPADLGLEPTIASGITPAPASPRVAQAVTMGSGVPATDRMPGAYGSTPPPPFVPHVDTNPGIAATVDGSTPFPRRASAATAFGAITAFLVVMSLIASIIVVVTSRRTTASKPPPMTDDTTVAVPAAQPAASPQGELSRLAEPVPEPVSPPSAAPSASSAPKPVAKPAPKTRNAEKDGYLKDL